MKYLVLVLSVLIGSTGYSADFTRHVANKTVVDSLTHLEAAQLVKPKNILRGNEFKLLVKEVHLLNKHIDKNGQYENGDVIRLPIYKKSGAFFNGHMDRWYYAVKYGAMYGVNPAVLIAVASHENPNNDGFAYGVMCRRGAGLEEQTKWAAAILGGGTIVKSNGEKKTFRGLLRNAGNPSRSDLYRCAITYVGTGSAGAAHWASCVSIFYRRATGK